MNHRTKKTIASMLALLLAFPLMGALPASAETVVLAPGTGLSDAVRNAAAGDTIVLSDGVYYVNGSVSVNKELSIVAEPWTHPIIMGGKKLTGWEKYSENIYRAPYTSATMGLIENGKAGKIATTPTYTATSVSGPRNGDNPVSQEIDGDSTINCSGIPSGLTANKAKVISYGAATSNWQSSTNVITDSSFSSLTFSGGTKRGISAGTKFEIINDKAVIDEPGEFAYDGSYVYYYPHDSASLENTVSIATTYTIFNVGSAGSLTLSGVDVAGANSSHSGGYFSESGAVSVNGKLTAQNCNFYAIDDNAIRYGGTAGLILDHCTFDGIGGSAIKLSGSNASITNCEIYNTGVYAYGTISISGNNNLLSHNRIAHTPVRGINLGAAGSSDGWGNIIEYNDVFDCNTKVSDTGLIYLYRMDGNTESRRNTIRYNAFHDSVTYNSMGFGIYLDDDADYTDVYGNWVYNLTADSSSGGFLMGPVMIKGVGSKIYDNVIANNFIAIDNQGGAGNNNAVFVLQALSGHTTKNNEVYNNIIHGNTGNNRLYRTIGTDNSLKIADYNVFSQSANSYSMSANGCWNVEMWQNKGFETHSLFGVNPQFTDPANGDFTVTNTAITSTYYNNTLTKDQIGPQAAQAAQPTEEPTPRPNDAILTVGNAYVSTQAETDTVDVEIPLTLSRVNNAAGLQIKLNYTKGITLKEVRRGTALPDLNYTQGSDYSKKPYVLLWDGESGDSNANGLVATLVFTVPTAQKATYDVVAIIDDFYDDDLADIRYFVKNGQIKAMDVLPGDMNGDGERNAKDVTLLRRAIASGTTANYPAADFNGDGEVSAKDITLLRRFIASGEASGL